MRTESGFEYTIAEGMQDDAELFDDLLAMDEGNIKPAKRVATGILGEDGQKRLYEHCRDEKTKRVSLKKVYEEISYILNHLDESAKNS